MNTVSKEERQEIYGYAIFLVEQAGGSENADLSEVAAAIQKFGISQDRARNAAAKAIRVARGREKARNNAYPP